jgi:glutamate racemase
MPDPDTVSSPIGVFDSGVGGLSVLRAIQNELPGEALIYFADQLHVPYGRRSMQQVRDFAASITRFLLQQEAKLVVVACNTVSAAALNELRLAFPETPFVGMEPALKPAIEKTRTRRVGVLATPVTFQGQLYTALVDRYAQGITVFQNTCPGLVEQIEAGDLESDRTRKILEDALLPMQAEGVDTIVLGCTHYPFVIPLIEAIIGANALVIDPAPAVARQSRRLLEARQIAAPQEGRNAQVRPRFYTSGDPRQFNRLLRRLVDLDGGAERVDWIGESLVIAQSPAEASSFPSAP